MADKAGQISTTSFRKPIQIVDKADLSPVTEIDRKVEQTLREMIKEEFPDHSVFGEEFGLKVGNGEDKDMLWIIDPIDGTLSYITGKPLFGTLIACCHKGRPVLGIIDQPVLGDRWLGVEGQPTVLNGEVVKSRQCSSVSEAYVYSTTPDMFPGDREPAYKALKSACKSHLYGADCYAYGLLATGFVDVVFEADMKIFDYAPMVPIVQGAGGIITDWDGNPLLWDGVRSQVGDWASKTLAVGDPKIHKHLLDLIK